MENNDDKEDNVSEVLHLYPVIKQYIITNINVLILTKFYNEDTLIINIEGTILHLKKVTNEYTINCNSYYCFCNVKYDIFPIKCDFIIPENILESINKHPTFIEWPFSVKFLIYRGNILNEKDGVTIYQIIGNDGGVMVTICTSLLGG